MEEAAELVPFFAGTLCPAEDILLRAPQQPGRGARSKTQKSYGAPPQLLLEAQHVLAQDPCAGSDGAAEPPGAPAHVCCSQDGAHVAVAWGRRVSMLHVQDGKASLGAVFEPETGVRGRRKGGISPVLWAEWSSSSSAGAHTAPLPQVLAVWEVRPLGQLWLLSAQGAVLHTLSLAAHGAPHSACLGVALRPQHARSRGATGAARAAAYSLTALLSEGELLRMSVELEAAGDASRGAAQHFSLKRWFKAGTAPTGMAFHSTLSMLAVAGPTPVKKAEGFGAQVLLLHLPAALHLEPTALCVSALPPPASLRLAHFTAHSAAAPPGAPLRMHFSPHGSKLAIVDQEAGVLAVADVSGQDGHSCLRGRVIGRGVCLPQSQLQGRTAPGSDTEDAEGEASSKAAWPLAAEDPSSAEEGVSDAEWVSETDLLVVHRTGRLVAAVMPLLKSNILGLYGLRASPWALSCLARAGAMPALVLLQGQQHQPAPLHSGPSKAALGKLSWNLTSLVQSEPGDMFRALLEHGDLGSALALAHAAGLDGDDVYKARWHHEIGRFESRPGHNGLRMATLIGGVLAKVKDARWVVKQCARKLRSASQEDVESLLLFGLQATAGWRDLAVRAAAGESAGESASQAPGPSPVPPTDRQRGQVQGKESASPSQADVAWMVRKRLRLLQYLERLHLFCALSPGRFSSTDYWVFRDLSIDVVATRLASAGRVSTLHLVLQRFPLSLRPGLLALLLFLPETLPPHSYRSLLPGLHAPPEDAAREPDWAEAAPMLHWCTTVEEREAWAQRRRQREESWGSAADDDFHMHPPSVPAPPVGAAGRRTLITEATESVVRAMLGAASGSANAAGWFPVADLVAWYQRRAQAIEAESGNLENCVALLDMAVHQLGLPGLQRQLQEYMEVYHVVYEGQEGTGSAGGGKDSSMGQPADLSLAQWQGLSAYDRFLLVLGGKDGASAEPSAVLVDRLIEKGMPLLRRHLAGPDEVWGSVVRWMDEELVARGSMDVCADALLAILHAASGTAPAQAQGTGRSPLRHGRALPQGDAVQAVQLAVSCVVRCSELRGGANAPSEWRAMEAVLQGLLDLPQLARVVGTEQCDKLQALVQCVQASRCLSLYGVFLPVTFFQECSRAGTEPAEGVIRRVIANFVEELAALPLPATDDAECAASDSNSEREADVHPRRANASWVQLWTHLKAVHGLVLSHVGPTFVSTEFCAALLRSGAFSLASAFLFPARPTAQEQAGDGWAVEAEDEGAAAEMEIPAAGWPGEGYALGSAEAEALVLRTARELFYAASSSTDPTASLALSTLQLLPQNAVARAELALFSAVVRTLPALGLALAPQQLSTTPDRLELVHQLLAANPGICQEPDTVLQLAAELGLVQAQDEARTLEAVARAAAMHGEFGLAYRLCIRLMRGNFPAIWDLCAALSRGSVPESEFLAAEQEEGPLPAEDEASGGSAARCRLRLLSYALAHCDEASLPELLSSWQALDIAARCSELGRMAGLLVPGAADQDQLLADLAAGRAAGTWEGTDERLMRTVSARSGSIASDLGTFPLLGARLSTGSSTSSAGSTLGGPQGDGTAERRGRGLSAKVAADLQMGRRALAAVAQDGEKWAESRWEQVPRPLLPFACLHLPWMLLLLRHKSRRAGSSTALDVGGAGLDVHPWLVARINQLILHALASCQVSASDRLVVESARVSLREARLAEPSRHPHSEEALGFALLLHAHDSVKAAAAIDAEIAKQAEFGAKRRLMHHLLQFAGVHAALIYYLPHLSPSYQSRLPPALPGQSQPSPVRPRKPSTPPEADASFIFSTLLLSPGQLLQVVRDITQKTKGLPKGSKGRLSSTAARWAHVVDATGVRLRTSEDSRLLRQALPQADPARFAARDLEYMERAVCSLVDAQQHPLSPSSLSTALLLADLYQLDKWQIHTVYLESVLLSDWTAEVAAEVDSAKHAALEQPLALLQALWPLLTSSSSIHPAGEGTALDRHMPRAALPALLALLATACAGIHAPVVPDTLGQGIWDGRTTAPLAAFVFQLSGTFQEAAQRLDLLGSFVKGGLPPWTVVSSILAIVLDPPAAADTSAPGFAAAAWRGVEEHVSPDSIFALTDVISQLQASVQASTWWDHPIPKLWPAGLGPERPSLVETSALFDSCIRKLLRSSGLAAEAKGPSSKIADAEALRVLVDKAAALLPDLSPACRRQASFSLLDECCGMVRGGQADWWEACKEWERTWDAAALLLASDAEDEPGPNAEEPWNTLIRLAALAFPCLDALASEKLVGPAHAAVLLESFPRLALQPGATSTDSDLVGKLLQSLLRAGCPLVAVLALAEALSGRGSWQWKGLARVRRVRRVKRGGEGSAKANAVEQEDLGSAQGSHSWDVPHVALGPDDLSMLSTAGTSDAGDLGADDSGDPGLPVRTSADASAGQAADGTGRTDALTEDLPEATAVAGSAQDETGAKQVPSSAAPALPLQDTTGAGARKQVLLKGAKKKLGVVRKGAQAVLPDAAPSPAGAQPKVPGGAAGVVQSGPHKGTLVLGKPQSAGSSTSAGRKPKGNAASSAAGMAGGGGGAQKGALGGEGDWWNEEKAEEARVDDDLGWWKDSTTEQALRAPGSLSSRGSAGKEPATASDPDAEETEMLLAAAERLPAQPKVDLPALCRHLMLDVVHGLSSPLTASHDDTKEETSSPAPKLLVLWGLVQALAQPGPNDSAQCAGAGPIPAFVEWGDADKALLVRLIALLRSQVWCQLSNAAAETVQAGQRPGAWGDDALVDPAEEAWGGFGGGAMAEGEAEPGAAIGLLCLLRTLAPEDPSAGSLSEPRKSATRDCWLPLSTLAAMTRLLPLPMAVALREHRTAIWGVWFVSAENDSETDGGHEGSKTAGEGTVAGFNGSALGLEDLQQLFVDCLISEFFPDLSEDDAASARAVLSTEAGAASRAQQQVGGRGWWKAEKPGTALSKAATEAGFRALHSNVTSGHQALALLGLLQLWEESAASWGWGHEASLWHAVGAALGPERGAAKAPWEADAQGWAGRGERRGDGDGAALWGEWGRAEDSADEDAMPGPPPSRVAKREGEMDRAPELHPLHEHWSSMLVLLVGYGHMRAAIAVLDAAAYKPGGQRRVGMALLSQEDSFELVSRASGQHQGEPGAAELAPLLVGSQRVNPGGAVLALLLPYGTVRAVALSHLDNQLGEGHAKVQVPEHTDSDKKRQGAEAPLQADTLLLTLALATHVLHEQSNHHHRPPAYTALAPSLVSRKAQATAACSDALLEVLCNAACRIASSSLGSTEARGPRGNAAGNGQWSRRPAPSTPESSGRGHDAGRQGEGEKGVGLGGGKAEWPSSLWQSVGSFFSTVVEGDSDGEGGSPTPRQHARRAEAALSPDAGLRASTDDEGAEQATFKVPAALAFIVASLTIAARYDIAEPLAQFALSIAAPQVPFSSSDELAALEQFLKLQMRSLHSAHAARATRNAATASSNETTGPSPGLRPGSADESTLGWVPGIAEQLELGLLEEVTEALFVLRSDMD